MARRISRSGNGTSVIVRCHHAAKTTEVRRMKIGFIGAGKVGVSLGKLFAQNGIPVTGYFSRTPEHTKQAAEFTGSEPFAALSELVEASDTLFVTTPDGAIARVWDDIAKLPIKSKMICHCSGSLSSEVFAGAQELGAQVCSVHPLLAVSDRFTAWEGLKTAFFTIEGTGAETMTGLMRSCGASIAVIDAKDKPKYHLAACVVSNLAVGLAAWGMDLLGECGFTAEQAQTALTPLILGNARNICEKGPMAALTGPAERGDVGTIRKHMACIPEDERRLYAALTERLCRLAQIKHPDREDTALTSYLEGFLL
ncbi:MAG: Rossmann-like and DUF2520 domain-containing protein [Butyricicoccaceae bacterium]